MSKFLIIGLGSAGSRAVQLLHELRPDAHLLTADPFAPPRPSDPHVLHYSDWRTLLEHHGDADALIICSPTENHLEQIMRWRDVAFQHFLVEKPVVSGSQYLAVGQWSYGVEKAAVNFQYRFDPGLAWLSEMLPSDRPEHLTFTGQDELLFRYGPHVDEIMCAHPIDTALWLLGPATGVDLESDGVQIRGHVTHERGESHYDFRMDTGPRASWLMSAGYKTALGHADNYRKALAAWLAWVDGGQQDRRTATLAEGLAVSSVLAQVRRIETA